MKRKHALTIVMVLIAFGGAIYYMSSINKNLTEVKAAEAAKGEVVSYFSTSGMVESKVRREYFVPAPSKVKNVKVKPYDRVKKGELLFEIEVEDLSLQLEAAERQYENARLLLEKLKSQREVALYNGTSSIPASSIPSGIVTYNDIKMQENAIEIARINLETLKKTISKQQSYLIAERDGVVTALNVTESGMASPQLPAVIVEDITDIQIVLNVNQLDINSIRVKQEVIVEGNGGSYSGIVEKISPVAVKSLLPTGSDNVSKVYIKLNEKAEGLKLGFEVDVKIKLGEERGVVKVPSEAVLKNKKGEERVFVVEKGRALERNIRTGLSSDKEVEIVEGLMEGERVVLNPLPTMENGIRVEVTE